jgi:hypothetical protein
MARHPAILLAAVLLFPAGAGGSPAVRSLAYEDDTLSVHLEEAPIGDVLAELGRASGAEIRGQVQAPRSLSVRFDRVPLAEALHRLLGEQNFTLRYGRGGRLRSVELLGEPEEPEAPATTAASLTPSPAPPGSIATLPGRFSRHRPLPVPERLGETLGSDRATFEELFDAATSEEDGVTRAQAMQVALGALERERVLRRSLFVALRRNQEGGLGEFLRSPRAIEVLEYFAAHSREPALQKKAAVLLEDLRARVRDAPPGG